MFFMSFSAEKDVNIMLIGLGPHAKRIYYPIIQKDGPPLGAKIKVIVDLDTKRQDIEKYLEKMGDSVTERIFITDSQRSYNRLNKELENILDESIKRHNISAVFICTEPLTHMMYARYGLTRGLNTLMDKPLSTKFDVSTDMEKAKEIISDYDELLDLKNKAEKKIGSKIAFDLLAQRRYHPAFLKLKNLISEVYRRTNCPVTSIQSFHSDGQWRMPQEIVTQDYHPYNQGYGKLSHSGYHSLDIMPWLLEAAEGDDKKYDEIDIVAKIVRPEDFYAQLNFEDYRRLFPDYDEFHKMNDGEILSRSVNLGEIDSFSTLAFKSRGKNITLGSINLVHNGFSQRNWVSAQGRDLYKGNGRVRHESHYIEQGPFQAISFISYQGEEVDPNRLGGIYDVGGEYHLDIHIFRNNKMFPDWKNYEKLSINDLNVNILEGYSRGHQEDARRNCIIDFVKNIRYSGSVSSKSSLEDHRRSVVLMSGMYQSICQQVAQKDPQVSFNFNK